jgi:hypothetical protein
VWGHYNGACRRGLSWGEMSGEQCHVGCVTIRRSLDWIYVFIALITHWLWTTSHYIATAKLHKSQFTTEPAKPFPACCVFTCHSLVTASNSGDSSASRIQVLSSPTLVQNCLPPIPSTELDRHLSSASFAALMCTQHYLAPRVAAVSHQPPALLFTVRLSTEHCQFKSKS